MVCLDKQLRVLAVRNLTVATVDSMGLVVLRCGQCSAGKSKKSELLSILSKASRGLWEFQLAGRDELVKGPIGALVGLGHPDLMESRSDGVLVLPWAARPSAGS
jgi:hypothetical protein